MCAHMPPILFGAGIIVPIVRFSSRDMATAYAEIDLLNSRDLRVRASRRRTPVRSPARCQS